MHYPRLTLAAAAFWLMAAMPVFAASGNVSSIGLQDFNHDGKIDRAIVSIDNPSNAAWQVRGTAGIGVSYQGRPMTIRSVFMASTGNPAKLEIVLENDALLPATTASGGFEVTYAPQGATSGVSDGLTELSAIASGDSGTGDTEVDQAGPVLLSSSPAAGTIDATRETDLVLTFSEPVMENGIVPSSAQNPDSWRYTASGDTLTVGHGVYGRGVAETFGLDAMDLAGNHVVAGAYPNPFSFRTGTSNVPLPISDTIFLLTSPVSLQALQAGAPNILAWHTNDASVTNVRLSYSTDGGMNYLPIAARPVTEGVYVWYPPSATGSITVKAEARGATGSVVNVSIVNPVSVTDAAAAPPRVLAGPDMTRLTDAAAKASVELEHAPASATATCGGKPSTVTIIGDRPARIETLAEGLTAAPITCRFSVSYGARDPLILETPSIAAASQQAPAPQGEGFLSLIDDDLIKTAKSSAVYWFKGGKRWVFPNETVYRSWFGTDFSKVLVVPEAQLAATMIGGNVKMKEGVYLIKIQSDPKTYAVEPAGALRWIQTEAQARALYGAAWAARVRDVDVSLFTDYAIGAPLQDGERPAGYAN